MVANVPARGTVAKPGSQLLCKERMLGATRKESWRTCHIGYRPVLCISLAQVRAMCNYTIKVCFTTPRGTVLRLPGVFNPTLCYVLGDWRFPHSFLHAALFNLKLVMTITFNSNGTKKSQGTIVLRQQERLQRQNGVILRCAKKIAGIKIKWDVSI